MDMVATEKFTLRPNQSQAVEAGIRFIDDPSRNYWSLMVLPTGAGKSIIIAKLAEFAASKNGGHTLVVQPKLELLKQNYAKYIKETGDTTAGIYSSGAKMKVFGESVTFCTPGSVADLGDLLKLKKLSLVIIDECDYGIKKNSVIDKVIKQSGVKKIVGLTATPIVNQSIEGALKPVMLVDWRAKTRFKEIIHVTQISEMVKEKYWTPIQYHIMNTDTQMLKFNSSMSEFTSESIRSFEDHNDLLQRITMVAVKKCVNMNSVLIFVESIATARKLEEIIKATPGAPTCIAIDSEDNEKRTIGVEGFIKGKYKICINVGILEVGFDKPDLDVIIDGYPTNSIRRFYQRVGRGVRICEGKSRFIYVDLAGNVDRFCPVEQIHFGKEDFIGWAMTNTVDKKVLSYADSRALQMKYNKLGLSVVKPDRNKGIIPVNIGKYKGSGVTLQELYNIDKSYYNWLRNTEFTGKTMLDLQNAAQQYWSFVTNEVIVSKFDDIHPMRAIYNRQ